MPTLLLCLDAPMQSWGIRSRFASRDTATEPTKSGVVGLLSAALGIPRNHEKHIAELAALTMGVRVDREGTVEDDYHTIQNVPSTEGKAHRTAQSRRFYLADALFLVALETPDESLLHRMHHALLNPRWPLHFGRKAFVPARPVTNPTLSGEQPAITSHPVDKALRVHPWLENQPRLWRREQNKSADTQDTWLRTVVDADPFALDVELRHDHPISFDRQNRRYAPRAVRIGHVLLTPAMIPPATNRKTP